jgi:two-component system LytT family sensor kinase
MNKKPPFHAITHLGPALLHLAFWALYAGLEYLANYIHYQNKAILVRDILLSLPMLMAATYFIALVLVPRLLWRRRRWLFLLAVLAAAVLVNYGRLQLTHWIHYLNEGYAIRLPGSKVFKNVLRDYAVIALAVCLQIIRDWDRKDLHNRRLQLEKQAAELQFLRAQIHPHFLFNTLNNLYGLALRRGDLAAEGILRLSALLDFILYECNAERIPLSRELDVIEKYIELEKLRYGERLLLNTDFEQADPQTLIVPLLLLPFVENCFKHGAGSDYENGWIRLRAASENGRLYFTAENSKYDNNPQCLRDQHIGLENVRRRLRMLYPNSHQLTVEDRGEAFCVRLWVNGAGIE